jgi:hypothetical protein
MRRTRAVGGSSQLRRQRSAAASRTVRRIAGEDGHGSSREGAREVPPRPIGCGLASPARGGLERRSIRADWAADPGVRRPRDPGEPMCSRGGRGTKSVTAPTELTRRSRPGGGLSTCPKSPPGATSVPPASTRERKDIRSADFCDHEFVIGVLARGITGPLVAWSLRPRGWPNPLSMRRQTVGCRRVRRAGPDKRLLRTVVRTACRAASSACALPECVL